MTMPEFGPRDLFFVSAGPGDLTTARALVGVAHKAGARSPPTASPPGSSTRCRSTQTIANDQGRQALGPADGLAVRDRAGDRFRNRDSQAPPALRVAWRNRASADPRARGRRRRCAWPFGADGARGAIAAGFAVKIWQSTVASDGRFRRRADIANRPPEALSTVAMVFRSGCAGRRSDRRFACRGGRSQTLPTRWTPSRRRRRRPA